MLAPLLTFQLGVVEASLGDENIRVMTLNQYLGADIAPMFYADAATSITSSFNSCKPSPKRDSRIG